MPSARGASGLTCPHESMCVPMWSPVTIMQWFVISATPNTSVPTLRAISAWLSISTMTGLVTFG
jgi:hypothetical protein